MPLIFKENRRVGSLANESHPLTLANSTSFREQQRTCRNLFFFWALGSKCMGCETPTGDKEGFFWLLNPASSSADRLLEADACVVPSYRSQGWHLVGLCSHFVSAAWSCISIQPWGCAASWEGPVCGQAQLLEDPGRSSCGETGPAAASVGGLRFEGQQACDRGVVQSCNSVGFIEDLFSSVCCSIKLREEKFWRASSSLVDLLILTQ